MIPQDLQAAFDNWGWWLASRASGIAALVFVTISVALGLMMASKLTRHPKVSRRVTAIHEQTALAGMFAIVVHAVTLVADPWLDPGLSGVLVPFTMDYRPLFTGLGVIAGLLALFLGLTFYIRRDVGAKFWRRAHRATILVYLLAVVHTIGAGSDASNTVMMWWLVLTTPPIVILFLYRVATAIRGTPGRNAKSGTSPHQEPTETPAHKAAGLSL